MKDLPVAAHLADAQIALGLRQRLVFPDQQDLRLDCAAQHDIGATAGHVGRDRDHFRPPGLGDDLRLAGVLLGVEDLVRKLLLVEDSREQLGILDRCGSDQHRLAALIAILDIADDRAGLFLEGPENEIVLIFSDHRQIGWDHHRFQMVDLLKLEGLGVRRTGHAGEFGVHAEVILKRNRRQRLVLALDGHSFLGFDGLMEPVGPAAPGHEPPGEFVDNDDFAVLNHIVLIAVKKRMCAKRRIQMVHQRNVVRVIQAASGRQQPRLVENSFGVLVTFLRQQDLMRFLIDPIIALPLLFRLPCELGRELVQPVIEIDVVVGLAGDDQRRARFVDQDGIDLVDDAIDEATLHFFRPMEDHVIAQIVEAELVVGAVGDVRRIRGLLEVVAHLRHIDADGQAQEAVDSAHPVGIALGEVIVDGDDVHTAAGQRIQVGGQRSDQRLAFAGAHFGDLPVVQTHAADQLHVEMAHLQGSFASFAHHRERLGHDRVERFPLRDPLLQHRRLRLQLVVRQRGNRGLQRIDLGDDLRVLLQKPLVPAAENLGKDIGDHKLGISSRRAK